MLIENQITISSPITRVWKVVVDVDSWPSWTPTVQQARRLNDVPFGLGSKVSLKQPLQSENIWRVTEFVDGSFFAWETGNRSLRMHASHLIAPTAGGCKCTLKLDVSGWMAPYLAPLIRLPVASAVQKENNALKIWCERRI